jgi:hypothetical protein
MAKLTSKQMGRCAFANAGVLVAAFDEFIPAHIIDSKPSDRIAIVERSAGKIDLEICGAVPRRQGDCLYRTPGDRADYRPRLYIVSKPF